MIFLCRKLVGNRYFALKQYNSFSQAKISNPFNGGSTVNSIVPNKDLRLDKAGKISK